MLYNQHICARKQYYCVCGAHTALALQNWVEKSSTGEGRAAKRCRCRCTGAFTFVFRSYLHKHVQDHGWDCKYTRHSTSFTSSTSYKKALHVREQRRQPTKPIHKLRWCMQSVNTQCVSVKECLSKDKCFISGVKTLVSVQIYYVCIFA